MNRHFGRATLCGLAGLAAVACMVAPAVAEEKSAGGQAPRVIPVEDFARAPQFEHAQLSPDGKYVGYIVRQNQSSGIGFLDLTTMKAEVQPANTGRYSNLGLSYMVGDLAWLSDRRIMVSLGYSMLAMDVGFKNEMWLPHFSDNVIYNNRKEPTRLLVMNSPTRFGEGAFEPEVSRVNTITGSFVRVLEARKGVKSWLTDWEGNIRFGLITDGVNTSLITRAGLKDAWSEPIPFGRDTISYSLAGLDGDGRTLYVFRPADNGRKALYAFDLQERKFSGPLFQHDKYDIDETIFSPKYRRLLGVRYVTEGPRQRWFEPAFANLQKEIDAAHPGMMNMIVSMDHDLQHVLVFSFSAREPGYYTLIDLAAGKSQPLAQCRPWLKPAEMADMFPVKCKARDGLELNGYLTLPAGRGQKNHPMVVFVHGGPWARDEWGFDPMVQFLANRGYAVLQVNYRGSRGYGEELYNKGRYQIGGAIQDDIVDMTNWAVQQGFADPHRLAIMGASYGGYSTLFALAQTPDLFRCGVACMAVTNWNSLFKAWEDDSWSGSIRYWRFHVGDIHSAQERARLASVSPVNMAAQIKAPVFLLHGENDQTVPIWQSEAMAAALKKAGHPAQTMFVERMGHWWPTDKAGVEFLTQLEAFLAKHLAP